MSEYKPKPLLNYLAGGVVAGVAFAVTQFLLNEVPRMRAADAKIDAVRHEMEQYQKRFSSDIEQHDFRISNNAANNRTALRMIGNISHGGQATETEANDAD